MTEMAFALRTSRVISKNPLVLTNKPDGMFIRKKDHLFTDHKPSAMIFTKAYDAEDFLIDWKKIHYEFRNYPFFLIQVEVEPVVQRQVAVLRQL
jgi:hypothetical protein